MKKLLQLLCFCSLLLFVAGPLSSCNKKSGCPINESVHTKTGKNGSFKAKKGKSNLFPKDMRRKKKN